MCSRLACYVADSARLFVAGCFWLLIGVHVLLGFIAIAARVPLIDVYQVQSLGCQTLGKGQDPYAMTFPDVYAPTRRTIRRGLVVNGQVQCGYCYLRLSLVLEFPSYLLAGDPRYATWSRGLAVLLIG